jgi:hypothetical protein
MTNVLKSKNMIVFLDTVKITHTKPIVAGIVHEAGTVEVEMLVGKRKGERFACEVSRAAPGARLWVGMPVK